MALLLRWINFNPSMDIYKDIYIHYKVWGEITYTFLDGTTVEV